MTTSNVESIRSRARELYGLRRYDEAISLLRQGLAIQTTDVTLLVNLGAVLHASGRAGEALEILTQAVRLDADSAVAHDNLAVVLRQLGRLDDALGHHRQALRLDPGFASAHANFGLCLEAGGAREAAFAAFRQGLALDESLPTVHAGIGRWHLQRHEWEDAEACFRRALVLEPRYTAALNGLAEALSKSGRHRQAVSSVRRAIRIAPRDVRLQLRLAEVLNAASRGHEALDVYRRLKRAGVGGALIEMGRASALSDLGRYPAALRLYRRILRANPRSPIRSGYLFALHASAGAPKAVLLKELRSWEQFHGAPAHRVRRVHHRNRDPERRLRIGYLSPDFRQHVVRQFFEPVMLVHDADRFEFFCYSETRREDYATGELKAVADRWYRTHDRSDAEVAEQIYRDRIDILVDLAGHTAHNRLGVLTYRPAPVQATYLGYFGSTGLSAIDYWITDSVLHPPTTEEPATEKIFRLPRCGFCYGAPPDAPAREAPEPEPGSPVTFGCFNNASKINFPVMDAFAAILGRVKDSRLVLKDRGFACGRTRRIWRQRFNRRGIDSARLQLLPASPQREYLASYHDIDIALDPFPRTGGTTTCDALWMGVPVITLAGARYVERLSATKLTAVGLEELITHSVPEYIELAVALATDRRQLARYHRTLRTEMMNSPLFDPVSLASALEHAYREFWRNYLR